MSASRERSGTRKWSVHSWKYRRDTTWYNRHHCQALFSHDALVIVYLVLNVFSADTVLSSATDTRMCQIYITIITVEFGHIELE